MCVSAAALVVGEVRARQHRLDQREVGAIHWSVSWDSRETLRITSDGPGVATRVQIVAKVGGARYVGSAATLHPGASLLVATQVLGPVWDEIHSPRHRVDARTIISSGGLDSVACSVQISWLSPRGRPGGVEVTEHFLRPVQSKQPGNINS